MVRLPRNTSGTQRRARKSCKGAPTESPHAYNNISEWKRPFRSARVRFHTRLHLCSNRRNTRWPWIWRCQLETSAGSTSSAASAMPPTPTTFTFLATARPLPFSRRGLGNGCYGRRRRVFLQETADLAHSMSLEGADQVHTTRSQDKCLTCQDNTRGRRGSAQPHHL